MSDQDLADDFVRHRGAVLDALLSESALSVGQAGPAPGSGREAAVEPPSAGAFRSVADSVPVERPDAGRAPKGPKASDRIMALLNGEASSGPSGLEFTSDFADRTGSRLSSPAESKAEPVASESNADTPAQQQKPASPGGAAGSAQQVLAMVRRPKVALALAGVLAVVIVLMLVTTGGGKDGGDQAVKVVTAAASAPSAAPSSSPGTGPGAPAAGSAITPRAAESHCPAGSTPGMDAFSGKVDKAWSCARAYHVDGQVLTIDLGKTYQIDSIGIVPGWDSVGSDGSDQWEKFRTVSRVSYQFNDPGVTTYTQQTMDQRSVVVSKISPAVTASKITLTVLQSKGGSAINTTAISSIVITGQ